MNSRSPIFAGLAALAMLAGWQSQAGAQIVLGSASGFEVLAGAGITVAGAVNSTSITGDIGTFPTLSITGLGNVVLNGTNHGGDSVTQAAKASLVTAYAAAAGTPATTTYGPIKDLGGLTLTPGVYNDPSSFAITGLLKLDAGGNPNAVFIFQAGSTLTAATSSEVRLINGAQASNVFWQVGSSATINGSAIFKGTILALSDITLITSATVEGRLLARNGAVTLDTNALALPLTAQTITFAAVPGHTACDVPFAVAPTASSGLPVTLVVTSGPATVSGNTVTLTGAVGTVVLTASQAGNGTFAAAPSVAQSFAVGVCPPTPQTITFAVVPAHTACDLPFAVSPTATSGLPVTLIVTSGPATVSGNTVTLTGAVGTVVLTTSQAGNGTFAAATNVVQSFAVTACPLTPQTITFAPVSGHTACDVPFTVSPTSTSGLPVTVVVTSGPATIAGNTVTLTGAVGTVVLTTTQAGNGTFAPAASVAQSFAVAVCPPTPLTAQAITFAAVPGHTACDVPFTVSPTASSGLPVTLIVTSGPATVSGNTVTLTGAVGTVVLTTSQAGNSTFAAATNVVQSFAVVACPLAPQTITFVPVPGHVACDVPFTVSPTSSSGLPVSIVVTSGPATISGNTVTLTGAIGTVVLTTTQAGNGTFAPAASVAQSFAVAVCPPTPQTITFAAISGRTACDAPFTFVAPTASSSLPVTLIVTSGPATVSGNTVKLTGGVGTVVLMATQAGNSTYSAAPSVVQSFVVVACAVLPVITSPIDVQSGGQPVSPNVQPGTVGTAFAGYQITASGSPTSFAAINLPPGLSVNALTGAITGTPTVADRWFVTVRAINAAGVGEGIVIFNIAPVSSSRIVNFSARALSGPGAQTLIVGFVVSGNAKTLLVRGVGPALASLGIPNALADPLLTLSGPAGAIATNDDWQATLAGQPDGSLLAPTAARLGAFALPTGSKDAALLTTVNSGAYTAGLLGPNSGTGVALAEIYDADAALGSRLINVSARVNVSVGEGTLIAGFVIAGNAPKTVLIRGIGPTLSVFGVAGVLADPTIALFSGSTPIATNDNWETGPSTAAQIVSSSALVGGFPLPSGSKDAVLLMTLQPGAYTVLLTGVGNTAGVALIEIYDTQ